MDIDSMEAGPEMDALIAEKVMGWRKWASPMVPRGSHEPDCWETGNLKRPTWRISGWNPSTDIAAAMEVVERIGGWIKIERFDGACYEVSFVDGKAQSKAPTAPLAICRAALKAVTKEKLE